MTVAIGHGVGARYQPQQTSRVKLHAATGSCFMLSGVAEVSTAHHQHYRHVTTILQVGADMLPPCSNTLPTLPQAESKLLELPCCDRIAVPLGGCSSVRKESNEDRTAVLSTTHHCCRKSQKVYLPLLRKHCRVTRENCSCTNHMRGKQRILHYSIVVGPARWPADVLDWRQDSGDLCQGCSLGCSINTTAVGVQPQGLQHCLHVGLHHSTAAHAHQCRGYAGVPAGGNKRQAATSTSLGADMSRPRGRLHRWHHNSRQSWTSLCHHPSSSCTHARLYRFPWN